MGQVIAALARIKRELQYLHARVSGRLAHFMHLRRQKTQILGNDRYIAQLLPHHIEKRAARPLVPLPVRRLPRFPANRIKCFESPEMVDPDHVKQAAHVFDPAHPPSIAVLFHVFPVINRIAPKLPFLRKRIGRAPGKVRRLVVVVKPKQLTVRPHVRAVRRHIKRNVPYQPYPKQLGIFLELCPLLIK